jgi:hypothetical protein
MDPSSWDVTLGSTHLPSINSDPAVEVCYRRERNTEFTNQECLSDIWGPFPIGDIVLLVHVDTKLLPALKTISPRARNCMSFTDPAELL